PALFLWFRFVWLLLCCLVSVWSSSDCGGLVDVPSFPTRRSSDLFQPVAALLKAWSVPFEILRLDQQHLDVSSLFERSGQVRYGRSEEHTSELQSRVDLVCRLLLEKKKENMVGIDALCSPAIICVI